MTSVFTAGDLGRALRVSLGAMRSRRGSIDAANVFPVPDGDTGTNLVMTLEATVDALPEEAAPDAEIAAAIKTASLVGARGNSGVILAQILRALAEAIETGPADAAAMAAGLARAHALATEAVLQPAEGTILSVAAAAAEAASGDLDDVGRQLDAVRSAAAEALARTPEQMPLLKRAGVVDAGGMGLVTLLDCLAAVANGREVPVEAPAGWEGCAFDPAAADRASLPFAYELQYLLEAPDETIPPLRQLLGTVGDSVAVVGGDGRWRVHVHTDQVERALGFGRALGTVAGEEVVAFADQIAAARGAAPGAPSAPAAGEDREAAALAETPGLRGIAVARAADAATLVAFAPAPGIARLFRELGAVVVEGRPSIEQMRAAVASAPSEDVIVLPNDEDLFGLALDNAREVEGKRVSVLRTTDAAEGLVVGLAYGDARPAADVLREMHEVLSQVATGQVVLAPESATTMLGPVRAGQAIAFVDGAPVTIEDDVVAAVVAVAVALVARGTVLTVLAGEGVPAEERARVRTALERVGAASVELHDGGQSKHRYLLAVE